MSAISSETRNLRSRRRQWPNKWLSRVMINWRRRELIRQLHELDDRQLYDIGIARDQIEAVVNARYDADVVR